MINYVSLSKILKEFVSKTILKQKLKRESVKGSRFL